MKAVSELQRNKFTAEGLGRWIGKVGWEVGQFEPATCSMRDRLHSKKNPIKTLSPFGKMLV